MALYSVYGETVAGIADAVRNMRHEKLLMTPAQIEAKIRASRLGIPIVVSTHINPATGEWERPQDWPDIDALCVDMPDEDCAYMTYDLRKTPGYGWIGIYCKTDDNTAWTATRGHIADGVFVADETITTNSNDYLRHALDDQYGDVQLWRISATGHINTFGFVPNTETNAHNYNNNLQPCVQRAGKLPWCKDFAIGNIGVNYNYRVYSTQCMERDALIPGKFAAVTNLNTCWNSCYSLQSLDLSGWDTTNWAVTNLSSCWDSCYSLQSLDLSGWDTTNWAVVDTRDINAYNYSLRLYRVPASFNIHPDKPNASANPNVPNLETFDGWAIYQNHSYNVALKLTVASLVSILTRLPAVTGKTITLGQNKLKLTSEQIAIATAKGWTVA